MPTNVKFFRGGTPETRYMWSERDYAKFGPDFATNTIEGTPPYDSHADGAYNLGSFVLGMPINPSIMKWQRDAIRDKKLAVGDRLWLFWIPEDHYGTFMNVKIAASDPKLAGASVKPVFAKYYYKGVPGGSDDGSFDSRIVVPSSSAIKQLNATYDDVEAVGAIAIDEPVNKVYPLIGADNVPLAYGVPSQGETNPYIPLVGFEIVSLPTDDTVTLDTMLNAIFVSLRLEAFECPTYY